MHCADFDLDGARKWQTAVQTSMSSQQLILNSEERRADGSGSEEVRLRPCFSSKWRHESWKGCVRARLTPGASGLCAGEGTSSTAAKGESCSMSVSCGG